MAKLELQPTPLIEEPKIAQYLGIDKLYIKHEEMNPSGSHKDRSIWHMIEYYLEQGRSDFVISSSGNAAVSAAYYVSKTNEINSSIGLRVFISRNINRQKRVRLEQAAGNSGLIAIKEVERPKQQAFQYAKEAGAVYLRGSQDDIALKGYEDLSAEILRQVSGDDFVAIFIPTSSGAAVVGIYNGMKKTQIPSLHIVQTAKIHPMAGEFDRDFEKAESSLASAIVDNVAHRKNEVVDIVKETDGRGWVISDEDLRAAEELYLHFHTEAGTNYTIASPSYDSLLSLAGLIRARKKGRQFDGTVVLLFTGE